MFHFPFACIGFFALIAHGYAAITVPVGIYFVLTIFVTSMGLNAVFFFFNPIQPMDVNKYSTRWLYGKNKFLFLVVNYHNSSSIPPGSFFLIYSNQQLSLSFFHAHSFAVFSTQNRQIAFLIRCRISKYSSHASFTQQLSLGKYPSHFSVFKFHLI